MIGFGLESMAISVKPSTQTRLEGPLTYLPASCIVEYKQHQVIYNQARPPAGLYVVLGGLVKVSRITAPGRQVIIDVYRAGEFFGESSLLGLAATADEARAIQDATLMNWTALEIQDIVLKRPQLAAALMRFLIQQTMEFGLRMVCLSTNHTAARLARALLRFGDRLGGPEDQYAIRIIAPLTHQMLAQYVGTSREVVSHHMSRFRRRGYVRYSRKELILFPGALQQELRQKADLGQPA